LEISCIILAGGKGQRLRGDKARELVRNRSLLEWVVFNLSSLSNDITVVIAQGQSLDLSAKCPELKIVTDIYPGKGPLGGVYTGLTMSNSLYNLVIACDMPFVNRALLRYMMRVRSNFDLIVPRLAGMVEMLHAVYSKNCLPVIEDMIKQEDLAVSHILNNVNVRYVEINEIDRFDPNHISFFNVNLVADLVKARKLAGEQNNDKC
jgi:molybdopterin-guanine dinucleotide biosynthesis protein A